MESTSSVPGRRYADVDEFCRAVRRRHFGRRVRTALVVLAAMLLVAAVFRSWYLNGGEDILAWRALCETVATNIVERQLVYEKEASCMTVGLFDTDSGVKRCEHGARSAECLQRAA